MSKAEPKHIQVEPDAENIVPIEDELASTVEAGSIWSVIRRSSVR